MPPNELLHQKREDILRIASKRGAYNVRVFGSVARGEADSKSDTDLLVDLEPGRSIFDLGGLLMDLQDLLGQHELSQVNFRTLKINTLCDFSHTLVLPQARCWHLWYTEEPNKSSDKPFSRINVSQ